MRTGKVNIENLPFRAYLFLDRSLICVPMHRPTCTDLPSKKAKRQRLVAFFHSVPQGM